MATELEQILFDEELQAVRGLPEASRWQLERDKLIPLGLFAVMHSITKPTDLYRARIRWTDYFGPFSLKFINMVTGADNDPTAWPRCFGFWPTSLDACLPWTAKGHGLFEFESARGAWPAPLDDCGGLDFSKLDRCPAAPLRL